MSLILALAEALDSLERVKEKLVFTTHTPLIGAHQRITKNELQTLLPKRYLELISEKSWQNDELNFTEFCIQNSKFTNGVAKKHMQVTKKQYPKYNIGYVTNGTHHTYWTSKKMKELFDKHMNNWREDPFALRQALQNTG